MRTVIFPAQGDLPACSMDFPYSESGSYTIFSTPQGYIAANGIGNILTGIVGEKKILEITLHGKSGVVIGETFVTDVVVTDASDEEVLQAARDKKKAGLAAVRYEIEVSGVNVGTQVIATDDRSKAMVTGAALKAMQDSEYSCRWKGVGGFVELTAPQILAIADAVRAHVQSCFDREAELLQLIDAAESPEELAAIIY